MSTLYFAFIIIYSMQKVTKQAVEGNGEVEDMACLSERDGLM
jgi:hypothetical protein